MNPITSARMEAGLSKQAFSKRLRLSRTYIIRAEQGCYVSPGDKLIEFSCVTLQISHTEFKRLYQAFQSERRAKAVTNLEPIQVPNRVMGELDPSRWTEPLFFHDVFKKWREDYWNSPITMASSLCLHPDSVSNYELGAYNSMPIVMTRVFREFKLFDSSFNPEAKWCYVYV